MLLKQCVRSQDSGGRNDAVDIQVLTIVRGNVFHDLLVECESNCEALRENSCAIHAHMHVAHAPMGIALASLCRPRVYSPCSLHICGKQGVVVATTTALAATVSIKCNAGNDD